MITDIKMKKCASYDSEGGIISGCTKINFIYGPNGSGKSTISNFLRTPEDSKYSDSEICWGVGTHSELLVYNKKFRETNFGTNDIPGVFTLGEDAIEEVNKVEDLRKRRQATIDEKDKRAESKQKEEGKKSALSDSFRDTIWAAKDKEHLAPLRQGFSGFLNSKDKFAQEVLRRAKSINTDIQSLDELIKKSHTLFGEKPEAKSAIVTEDIIKSMEEFELIEEDLIWETVVIGNQDAPIGKLIQALGNSDWVNTGRKYITVGNVCPFCQETVITDSLKKQLDAFFSGEYEEQCNKMVNLNDYYLEKKKTLQNIFDTLSQQQNSFDIGKMNREVYEAALTAVIQLIDSNVVLIKNKMDEPSHKVTLTRTKDLFQKIIDLLNSCNDEIKKHNEMVRTFSESYKTLIDEVWDFFINENISSIKEYEKNRTNFEKAINGIGNCITQANATINSLTEEILEAEKNITSTQPAVDEINRSLAAYGFTNFKIVPSEQKENSYQIQRPDGTLANDTLSEGEETFISFLYFIQMAKGSTKTNQVSGKRILVLDDPISSLDSTVLYIVSAMVKELIKKVQENKSDIEQIFVLTHNVFFHKEASFIKGRSGERADTHYWIIRKDKEYSSIKEYGIHNPISTSYELLWKELRDSDSSSYVVIQNIMRRIIENYFNMVGHNKDEYLEQSFETPEEQMICRSLLYWINDGSHSIPDDLFIDSYTPSIEKYKEVFYQIFVQTGNEAHYNMMMGYAE